jgi:hypothetical protein
VAGTFAEDFAVASDRVVAVVLASDRVVADNTEEEDTDMVPAISDTAALV